ncbi:MAG: hypothetical protein JKY15_03325 [Deltaproteobacteria bacterium]|nr:hypothetical protein [Deltaproteobacteria bacterium]
MFDNLYLIQERETGKPHSARTDNPDSTLFGVSYPKHRRQKIWSIACEHARHIGR